MYPKRQRQAEALYARGIQRLNTTRFAKQVIVVQARLQLSSNHWPITLCSQQSRVSSPNPTPGDILMAKIRIRYTGGDEVMQSLFVIQ